MQKLQVGSKVIVFMFILIMEMASLTKIQIRMHFQTAVGVIVLVEKHMILQYIKEKV